VRAWLEWDWSAAAISLDRAIQLNPRLGISWMYRGLLAAALGRTNDAVLGVRKALELEPDSALLAAIAGNILHMIGQLEEAHVCANRAIELDSSLMLARRLRAQLDADLGNYAQAIGDAERTVAEAARSADQVATLGYAYARAGRRDDAQQILRELLSRRSHEYVSALGIADLYAALDDREEACAWLERAYEERNGLVSAIATAPHYNGLRDEPRFRALVRRMHLRDTP
jgi:tetratricopeptide (TPR) repeat protein